MAHHGQGGALRRQRLVAGRVGLEYRNDPAGHDLRRTLARSPAAKTAREGIAGNVDVAVDEPRGHHEPPPLEGAFGAYRAGERFALADGDDPIVEDGQGAVLDDPTPLVHGDDGRA